MCPCGEDSAPAATNRFTRQVPAWYGRDCSLTLSMGMIVVRVLLPALGLTIFLFHSLPAPLGGSVIGQAAAQSHDELYKKCRRAVFRRYGQPGVQYNRAPGRRVLPSKFAIGAIDHCVASGGRAI
jgi:hypothetical protein